MFDVSFFFQAEDGIRDLVRSRGLGDVYKRQDLGAGEVDRRPVPAGELRVGQRVVRDGATGGDRHRLHAARRGALPVSYTHLTLPTIYSV